MKYNVKQTKSNVTKFFIETIKKYKYIYGILDLFSGYISARKMKSLYGLKQSPRCWNKTFSSYLESKGYKQSEADPCIYFLKQRLKPWVIM